MNINDGSSNIFNKALIELILKIQYYQLNKSWFIIK